MSEHVPEVKGGDNSIALWKTIRSVWLTILICGWVQTAKAQSPLPDPEFNPATSPGDVLSIAVQPDGRILVGGESMSWTDLTSICLGRLNRDGSPDDTFTAISYGRISTMAVQEDGKIIVGGVFGTGGVGGGGGGSGWGETRLLARLNADGILDADFDPQADGDEVWTIAVQKDGKILVGGDFTGMEGQPRSCIARLNPDGTLDTWFIPSANGPVMTLAVQVDGKILVGGAFTAMNGHVRNRLARLNPDGTLDVGFNPNANDEVLSLALQPDGKILVGGNFNSLSGQTRNRIARLNPDGSLDLGFNPYANGAVVSLAMRSDGHILVGGRFSIIGGQVRRGIAQLDATGMSDAGFDPQADGNVECVAVQADGKALVGGWFVAMGGLPRFGIARLSDTNAVKDELTYDGDAIVWDRDGAGPEVSRTTFEYSPDGTEWMSLGEGNRIDGGWAFEGLTMTGGLIRARGYTLGGHGDAAGGIVETTNALAAMAPGHYLLNRAFYDAIAGEEWCWFHRNAPTLLADYTNFFPCWWPPLPSTSTYSYYSTWRQHVLVHLPAYMESGPAVGPCWYCAQLSTWEDSAFRQEGLAWLAQNGGLCHSGGGGGGGGPNPVGQPASCTNEAGQTASFTVVASGSEPLAYQWRKGGVNLNDGGNVAGAATATLTLYNVMRNDEGAYDAVVSNYHGGGAATSDVATLTVVDPVIIVQPAGQLGYEGQAVNLQVIATGTGPLNYQWRKNGLDLPFAHAPTLSIASLQETHQGRYDVVVSGLYGCVTSATVTVALCLDGTFDPEADYFVDALAIQADGRILVGGRFTSLAGEPRQHLAQLNADGSLDAGFNPEADGDVYSLVVQHDGKILVGGAFTSLGGQTRPRIARLNPNGSLDDFDPDADGPVYALVEQPDGKILVGGEFTTVGGQSRDNIARLNADGTIDTDFNPGANGYVGTLAVQPADGGILVGGCFTSLNGQYCSGIARLHANGDFDALFHGPSLDVVTALAIQSDGKILLGCIDRWSDQTRFLVERLDISGNYDPSFIYQDADNPVLSLITEVDGRIMVGGGFSEIAGQVRGGIARLNADGTLDTGFTGLVPGAVFHGVTSLALQTDGRILAGGATYTPPRFHIARFNNTEPATQTLNYDGDVLSWCLNGTGPTVWWARFEHTADGLVWTNLDGVVPFDGGWRRTGVGVTGGVFRARGHTVSGYGNASGGMIEICNGPLLLSRQPASQTHNAGTTVTLAVGAVGSGPVSYQWRKDGTNLYDGGNVSGAATAELVLGDVRRSDQGEYDVIVNNADGCLTSMVAVLTVTDPAIIEQPTGRYVVPGDTAVLGVVAVGTGPLTYQWRKENIPLVGATNALLSVTDIQVSDVGNYDVAICGAYGCVTSAIAVLAECVDITFDTTGADAPVRALALQADGRILVGGWFTTFANQERNHIARLNADGTLDSGFNPNANGEVCALAVQPDGKILVGGGFTSMAGQSCERIARLNADGTVDSSFTPGADNDVYVLVVQTNGAILAGGAFSSVAGQTRHGIALLHADGTLDGDFDPDADGVVRSLAVQADGKIVAGGGFTSMAGQTRNAIARLNVDGSLDPDFNPGATGEVKAIAIQADGKVLLGGEFTAIANHARSYLARLDSDGTLDQVFDPRANEQVSCLAVQADGSILVGGVFTALKGEDVRFLGRLNADGSVDKGFNPAVNDALYSLTIQADGKVLLGGWFSTVAGRPSGNIARLNSLGVATQELGYDGNIMSWRRGGTSPEVWRTTFEHSINGTAWTALGAGARTSGGWQLTGVAVTGGVVRARGYTSGCQHPSSGMVETRLGSKQLRVLSPFGMTVPATGDHWYFVGTAVDCAVINPTVLGGAGTRYVCIGATVNGNACTLLDPGNVTLSLTNDATLTWLWTTNYWLGVATTGVGAVSVTSGWQTAGSNVTIVATPTTNSHFVQWLGDTNGCFAAFTNLTVPMTQARAITAMFGDGVLPYLSIAPASQDFGTMLVGSTADRTFTVQNLGGGILVGTASMSAPFAVVSGGSYSLAAGASQIVTVRYAPTSAGSHAGNVVFTGGAGASRPVTGVAAASAIISGRITRSDTKAGMPGVTITFTNVGTATSGGNGNYSMLVPFGWSGTSTATITNGGFAKPILTFKAVTKNQTKKNFVWSPDPVISGTVTRKDTKVGLADVTITASPGGVVTTTEADGTYSLTVPYNWTGVVTPSVAGGGTFKKPSVSYSNLTKSKAKQKYVWTPLVPAIVSQAVSDNNVKVMTAAPLMAEGFTQWAHEHGLVGNPADLFDQINSDGISYGAEYTFGANLLKGESLVRLLTNNGILTAEIPLQDPATLRDAKEQVEFTIDPATGFWFPAVCLPPQAATPATKQWFWAGHGEAVDFRVRVELVR